MASDAPPSDDAPSSDPDAGLGPTADELAPSGDPLAGQVPDPSAALDESYWSAELPASYRPAPPEPPRPDRLKRKRRPLDGPLRPRGDAPAVKADGPPPPLLSPLVRRDVSDLVGPTHRPDPKPRRTSDAWLGYRGM